VDNLTPAQRRKNMQNIRCKDTKPELLISRNLRKKRIYFARNVKTIFGKPDIVFRTKRIALFIDSDFWHGHPKRCIMPKTNKSYWNTKISGNRARDKKVNKVLKSEGWKVIRVWEYDIKHKSEFVINKILKALNHKNICKH
jgi:DNA mismatch endonuclease (patch repair protein)